MLLTKQRVHWLPGRPHLVIFLGCDYHLDFWKTWKTTFMLKQYEIKKKKILQQLLSSNDHFFRIENNRNSYSSSRYVPLNAWFSMSWIPFLFSHLQQRKGKESCVLIYASWLKCLEFNTRSLKQTKSLNGYWNGKISTSPSPWDSNSWRKALERADMNRVDECYHQRWQLE